MGSDTTAVVCHIAVTVAPFEHLGRYHSLVIIRPAGKFISLLFTKLFFDYLALRFRIFSARLLAFAFNDF